MIKLIVSDLDGTLLDHHKQVSLREQEQLAKVKEAGLQLCLASGRNHFEIQKILSDIGHQAYSLSQNGAFIHLDDGTFFKSKLFEAELAHQVYQLLHEFDLVKLVCSIEGNYIANPTPASDAIERRMFQPLIVKANLEHAFMRDLPTSKFSLFGQLDLLLQVKARMEAKLGERLELFISDKDCLDIMPRHVSKGSSLLVLMEQLDLKPEEVACVGDSFNDVSMFGVTPHSFAMHGAHPDVKKRAAYQVHSVSEAIEHVFDVNQQLALESKGSSLL